MLKRHILKTTYFMRQEMAGSIVLAIAVIAAMVLANSPLKEAYAAFFQQELGFSFNGATYLNF